MASPYWSFLRPHWSRSIGVARIEVAAGGSQIFYSNRVANVWVASKWRSLRYQSRVRSIFSLLWESPKSGRREVWTRDLPFNRPAGCHCATDPMRLPHPSGPMIQPQQTCLEKCKKMHDFSRVKDVLSMANHEFYLRILERLVVNKQFH